MFRSIRRFLVLAVAFALRSAAGSKFLLALAVLALGATPTSAQLVRSAVTTATSSASVSAIPTPTLAATVTIATSGLPQTTTGLTLERVPVVAPPCTDAKLDEIFEAAGPGNTSVSVDCSFSFAPFFFRDRITKQLLFTGNTQGVTVDCLGGAIDGGPGSYLYDNGDRGVNIVEVVSSAIDGPGPLRWSARPQDITIRDCEIIGSARIWPLNLWVEGNNERLAALSRQPGYVATLRANAPRGIRFVDVVFRAQKHTPLYIGPGVTETEVSDSWFLGGARGVILYLDTESSRNVIRNNQFHAQSDLGDKPREIIAIDASDHNLIVGNYFSALDHGGIYLYRNCGEDHIVRFTTPSHNKIINNVFYYNHYDGQSSYYDSNDFAPAVFLGSRNNDRDYCSYDNDFAGGSGADNRSFATHNVVMQNQFYKRSVANSVVTKWTDVNVPNYVAYNEGDLLSHQERPSGCHVDTAYGQFLRDGETTRLLRSASGAPTCRAGRSRCDDGEIVVDPASIASSLVSCQIDRIPFTCGVSGDNRGCTGSSICPSGTTLVRTAAACNLEFGSVTTTQLTAITGNDLRVVRSSDDIDDGSCHAGSASISSGQAVIERQASGGRVYFGCSEHDENGGDCQVRGELYCQNERLLTSGSINTGAQLSTSGSISTGTQLSISGAR